MVIQSIASSYVTPTTKKSSASDTVSKDDFLKLLVTQLQKQDPLNPSDPTEFTSQLTQYSSLEQLMSVNDNLGGLSSLQTLNAQLSASSMIGKSVKVQGTDIAVSGGKASTLSFELPSASAKTSVNVYNAKGDLVDVVDLGSQEAGAHDFQWDARRSNGAQATDGSYKFELVAQDSSGKAITATSSLAGTVTGVTFDANGQTLLEIGGKTYKLGDVLSISAAG